MYNNAAKKERVLKEIILVYFLPIPSQQASYSFKLLVQYQEGQNIIESLLDKCFLVVGTTINSRKIKRQRPEKQGFVRAA